jgi:two-component system sensor histidine kinase/response regulator
MAAWFDAWRERASRLRGWLGDRLHPAAARTRRRMQLALQVGGVGVWEYDPVRRRVVGDARCLELLGFPEGTREFRVVDWLDRVLPDDRAEVVSRGAEWLRATGASSLRFRATDRSGRTRWLSCEFSPVRSQADARIGVLVDVTEDMALIAQRESASRRAELALSVAGGFFFDLDLGTGRLSRDARAREILELPSEDTAVGLEALFGAVPEFARPAAIERASRAITEDAGSFDLEVPVAGEDDALRYFRVLAYIERDATGRALRIDGMAIEVSEARRVRRALERVSTRFELAAEAGQLGLYELDLRDDTVVQTPIGARLFGLPTGAPIPVATYLAQIHPDDRGRVEQTFREAIAGGGSLEMVLRVDFGQGVRWVRSAGRIERNDRGLTVRVAGVNWDITADIEARDRIARANDRLGLALAAANASVWEYSGATDRITWDERGVDLYGIDPNAGGDRLALIAQADRAEIAGRMRMLRVDPSAGDAGFVLEYRIHHPRTGLRWVRCIGRRGPSSQDPEALSVGIDIDVTAERTAAEAMEQARLAAEAASRAKGAFLANMSHEIRTPMNAIIGMTGLAHRATSLAQSSSYAAQAHAAARSLLTVLNDVLDFSKIEAGRLDVERIAFPIETMLAPVLDVTGFAAAQKHLSVVLDVGPDVPARCVGDPARISQILLNLAGNAVKFTEAGFVRINVRRPAAGRLRFEVVDSGVGLSAAQQREVFEPFTQGDPSTSRRFGGTGLGLTICRRLADLMHGEMGVLSTPGQGATFWLELPIGEAVDQAPLCVPLRPAPRVALAHGDPQVRDCLGRQAVALGAEVTGFADEPGLLAWLALQPPGPAMVVCVDPRLLPAERGPWLGAVAELHCRPRVVLLSRRLSTLAPGEAALLEPVLPSSLRRALDPEAALPVGEPIGPLRPSEGGDADVAASGSLAGTDVLLVEDNDLNRALVIAILAESGATVREAHDGTQAVAAVRRRVPDVVLMDIHMPLMDGYQATAAIRALGPAGRDLPIIATTADALEGDRDRALRAGMNDHLVKPLEPARLIAALQRWGGRRPRMPSVPGDRGRPGLPGDGGETVARTTLGSPDARLDEPALLDRAEGLRGCLGRPALLAQTLRIFVDVYGPVVAQLAEGGDEPDLARLAHTLKGSVRALGMMRLAELALTIDGERRAGKTDGGRRGELREVLECTLEQARVALQELEHAPVGAGSG